MRILKSGLNWALAILFAISVAAIFLANEDPYARAALCDHIEFLCFKSPHGQAFSKIIYDIGIASLISLIFYIILIQIPDFQRRRRLKRSLSIHYKHFKEDCIGVFLAVSNGSYDATLPEILSDQTKFKEYFKEQVSDSQTRWDTVANNLNGHYLQELITQMEMFRDEINFVLNNTDLPQEVNFKFFKQISSAIYFHKKTGIDYDSTKRLCRFFWELFAAWDWGSGYRKRDLIEEMIDAI